MDCAPTVGVGGEPGSPIQNDAARRVATVFEKWNCVIESYFYTRNGKPSIKNAPYAGFAAVPLLEYGCLNLILPIPEGRSDAACRVVILPFAVPVDVCAGVE